MTPAGAATVELTDHAITISRVLNAPRALVYRVWNDAAHITRWWGPDGFTTTTHSRDFTVGGQWRFTMHGPDGTDYPNLVTYTAIDPERLVAYDHGESAARPRMFRAEITFADAGEKTLVTLRMVCDTAEQCTYMKQFGAIEGGEQTLSRLDAVLAAMRA